MQKFLPCGWDKMKSMVTSELIMAAKCRGVRPRLSTLTKSMPFLMKYANAMVLSPIAAQCSMFNP